MMTILERGHIPTGQTEESGPELKLYLLTVLLTVLHEIINLILGREEEVELVIVVGEEGRRGESMGEIVVIRTAPHPLKNVIRSDLILMYAAIP